MKKFLSSSSVVISLLFILALQFAPIFVFAAENDSMCGAGTISCFIVKCNYDNAGNVVDPKAKKIGGSEYECGFNDVIREVNLLTSTAFKIAVPITIIAIAWAGIKILLAQGNGSKITEAKEMLKKVVIGFIFILTAWLIVYTITSYLLKPPSDPDGGVPTFLSN